MESTAVSSLATCDESCGTKAAGSTIVKLGLQKCCQIRLDQSQRTHRNRFKVVCNSCSCTWILDTTESKADRGPGCDVCALFFCAGGSVGPCHERTLRKAWICVYIYINVNALSAFSKLPLWTCKRYQKSGGKSNSMLDHYYVTRPLRYVQICAHLISFAFPGQLIFEASNCCGPRTSSFEWHVLLHISFGTVIWNRTYMGYPWDIHGISMGYTWHTMRYTWDIHGISMGYTWPTMGYAWDTHGTPWDIHGISMGYTWHTMGYPWDIYGIHMAHHGISMGYLWDTHGTPWDIHGISMGYTWHTMGYPWDIHGIHMAHHGISMGYTWHTMGKKW